MGSPALAFLARSLALVCGFVLLVLTFMGEILFTETGRGASVLVPLLLFGFPCGVLLNFARSGRRVWRAGLVVPALAIVQALAVLAALRISPHSRISHVAASVAASWVVLLVGRQLFRRWPRPHAA